MISISKSIRKYLGWRNWAVFKYNSIFENLFILFFIIIMIQDYSNSAFLKLILFLVLSFFSTTYGYLINDYADIDLDRLHGKTNTFEDVNKKNALLIVIGFLCLIFVLTVPFRENITFVIIYLFWILLTTFYSLPPIRLKERGLSGLIAASTAQRFLPVLLSFAVFSYWELLPLIIILIYILLRGLTSDLNHQIQDYVNDSKTSTKTAAVTINQKTLHKLFILMLHLERVFLPIVLIVFIYLLHMNTMVNLIYLDLLFILYFILYLISIFLESKNKSNKIGFINPYLDRNLYQFLHLVFPNIIITCLLLFYLIFYNYAYLLFIFLILFSYQLFSLKTIKNSYIGQLFRLRRLQ